jgi:D-glycero-D-manno-heptose 1,7-bisphosphate phosphatase
MPTIHRAVFIDRDGVICRNREDHVKSWNEFVFLPGALNALARLARLDLPIVVVTNQAIINRHIVTAEVVEDIHSHMVEEVQAAGGRIDRVMYCPHRPDEQCGCRKPQPGMLLQVAEELDIDLCASYVIGDAKTDMQAGQAVGSACYLVLTGRGREQLVDCWLDGEIDFEVVPDLGAAVGAILCREYQVQGDLARLLCWEGQVS